MAGSCTVAEERHGSVKRIQWTWTADSAAQAAAASRVTTYAYNGSVLRLVTVPDSGSAPSASYSVEILDGDSVDVLVSAGASRHSANTEQITAASLGILANDTLTLNCTSMGASVAGVVILYIR